MLSSVAFHARGPPSPGSADSARVAGTHSRASLPIASTTLGAWATDLTFDAAYWGRNLRDPVRFTDAVTLLIESGCSAYLEIGPHPVLRDDLAECARARGAKVTILATLGQGEDDRVSLRGGGALQAAGNLSCGAGAEDTADDRAPGVTWKREW